MKRNMRRAASLLRLRTVPGGRGKLGFVCLSIVAGVVILALLQISKDQNLSTPMEGDISYFVNLGDDVNQDLVTLSGVEEDRTENCFADSIPGVNPFRKVEKVPLYKPIVDKNSSDACAEMLKVDKVALMILAKGNIHHHLLWRQWFASAAGRIPKSHVCDSNNMFAPPQTEAFRDGFYDDVCSKVKDPMIDFEDPMSYQVLFSLYVHVPPGGEHFLDSFFRKYLISRQVKVEWGEHSMIHATRELLWFAFKDPLNTRFVLLSESDIPIYGPLQVYYQMQNEKKSRVDTSDLMSTDKYRWNFRFLCGNPPIREKDWKKSSQWFTLIRDHALHVLNDVGVYRSFERYCTSFFDDVANWYRVCYSDEHYVPTLLGMVVNKTMLYPIRGPSHVDFSNGGAHPFEYSPTNISSRLFYAKLRVSYQCIRGLGPQTQWSSAIDSSFVSMFHINESSACEMEEEKQEILTSTSGSLWSCPLLARKFKIETADAVLGLFEDCDNVLGIIDNERVCPAFKEFGELYEQNEFKSRFFGNG